MEMKAIITMYVCNRLPRLYHWTDNCGPQVAVSQFFGLQLLRLADATVLPFNTTHYTSMLSSYLD